MQAVRASFGKRSDPFGPTLRGQVVASLTQLHPRIQWNYPPKRKTKLYEFRRPAAAA
jgi:hypothetical protein